MYQSMDTHSTSGQTASGQGALESAGRGESNGVGFEESAWLYRSAARKRVIPQPADISTKTRFCIHTHLNAPCSRVCIWSASCASCESSFKLQKPKWTCKCCPLGLKIHVCLRNC